MTTYNYLKQEKEDVLNFINENYSTKEQSKLFRNKSNDPIAVLYERLINDDSVTGNGSGSYTFNILQAEENLVGNWSLLQEAIKELDPDFNILGNGPESCDVLIRIYLLTEAIQEAINSIEI